MKYVLGVGVVVAMIGIGTTLASTTSISINGNNTVEFGQGVTQTVFCGGTEHKVTVTPVARFVPGTGGEGHEDKWLIDTLEVSNIAEDCVGKDFVLQDYNKDGALTPWAIDVRVDGSEQLADATTLAVHYVANAGLSLSRSATDYRRPNPADIDVSATGTEADGGSFLIIFGTEKAALSSSIGKITIETQDDTFGDAHPES